MLTKLHEILAKIAIALVKIQRNYRYIYNWWFTLICLPTVYDSILLRSKFLFIWMRLQETYTVWFRHYWSQINHFLCNLLKITKVNISAHYIRIHFISVLQSNLAKSVNDHGEMFIISFIPFLQDETISHISHISIFEALILNN